MAELKHGPRDALWVIWWTNTPGRPYPNTFSGFRRKEAIEGFTNFIGKPWEKMYRAGARCVRCNIVPAKKEEGNG
jgi:hypothetical protein